VVIPNYLEIDNELRKKRALDRENLEMTPKMAELTRRFEADEVDFSEEKLARAGINVRYKNHDIERCIEDINLSLLNK
jgi:guanylate kinase